MKNSSKTFLMVLSAAVLGSAATLLTSSTIKGEILCQRDTCLTHEETNNKSAFIRTATSKAFETDFTKAAESTVNAVVSINSFATTKRSSQNFIDPFEFFFGPGYRGEQRNQKQNEPQQQRTGLGSGVIISQDGYIVTNNHVINGADKLEVTLNDNRTFNAQIIGSDESTDLALIKIDADNLHAITFGDSDNLKVGEWVLAVGNPFGFTSTVTAGIVSAKARSIGMGSRSNKPMGVEAFIQTDAAVNPGNSGGALVNTNGELVGINTAIYSETGNYAGYSFAIPTSIVKKIVTDIKQYGTVQRAVLGISYAELTSELLKEKGISATNEGIYIASVANQSSAMDAGLKEGDVIVAIDGAHIKNSGAMQEQMSKYRPGDKIKVDYIRNNKKYNTNVTLRNTQGSTSMTQKSDFLSLGCAFKVIPNTKKQELRISNGLEVVGIKDGKFKNAGIKEGFIITDINSMAVATVDDIEKIYNSIMASGENDKVMFISGIYPTGKKMYYAVDLSE